MKREPSNNDKLMASQNHTYALQHLVYCLKIKMGDVQSIFDATNKRDNITDFNLFQRNCFQFWNNISNPNLITFNVLIAISDVQKG